jgi:hypothetical protein
MDALAEWAAGRRAAGDSWAAMEEQLADLPEDVVSQLPRLVSAWYDKQRLAVKRAAAFDRRAQGEVSVGAMSLEAMQEGRTGESGFRSCSVNRRDDIASSIEERWAGVSPADPILTDRANALRVVEYLRAGMLMTRWRWRYLRWWRLAEGETWETVSGAGSATLPGGEEVRWVMQAVLVRDASGGILSAFPECRAYCRHYGGPGSTHGQGSRLEIQRREADCRELDVRELAARLAAVMSAALGAAGSGIRDNAELARILGVSREAVRVRKLRITQAAGMRAVEGLAPARAAGGRASRQKTLGRVTR